MCAKFKKGNSEAVGRPKGSLNKKTVENREIINDVLGYIKTEYLYKDIDNLSSIERMKMFVALMEYTTPKLARQEHTGKDNQPLEIRLIDANSSNNGFNKD
jgi:hypothetical protein